MWSKNVAFLKILTFGWVWDKGFDSYIIIIMIGPGSVDRQSQLLLPVNSLVCLIMLIFELVLPNCPTFFVTTSHIPFVCYQISHIIAKRKGVQHHISVIWVSLVLKAEMINWKSGRRTRAACAERKFWEKYEYRQSVCQRPYQTRRTKQNNMLSNLRTQFLLRKFRSPVDQYVWSAFPQFYLSPWDGKGKQINIISSV